LGVQFNRPGETEQPRVQLVSVPYALKASDAETLGGLPAAAYMRVLPGEETGRATSVETSSASGNQKAEKPRAITGTPSNGSLVKFSDGAGDLGNSVVSDNGSSVAVAGQAAVGSGHASQTFGFDLYVNGNSPSALIDAYGNPGTASLLLQGRGSTPTNHALSVNSNGLFSITPSSTGIPAFSINQSGNLMAGTLSPWAGAKLQVRPGTNQNLAIGGPLSLASGVTFHSFNDAITANEGFEFRGSPIVFSVGNVGIGTPTPGAKLDVAGDINLSGTLRLHGSPILQVLSSAYGPTSTALGSQALYNNTSGDQNTAVGYQALTFNTTGTNNTAAGVGALAFNSSGAANTALGVSALQLNSTGLNNTAIGVGSLSSNTSGGRNVAVGVSALTSSSVGFENTAVGMGALQNNTTDDNTATGFDALNANTTGGANAAFGSQALQQNTLGSSNTAVGTTALISNTSGGGNTAAGQAALSSNITGNDNTAVGFGALGNVTTGSNNIGIGMSAGGIITLGSNNIDIGHPGFAGDDSTIRIGTPGTQTKFFVGGVRGITTAYNDAVPVVIDSAGQLGTVSSSRRYKEDIRDMGDASAGLMKLRPVTFRYRKPFADGSKPIQYGLIAEEVAEVYPDLVARGADGQIETVKYQVLDSMLLNQVQKQEKEITALKDQNQGLQERLAKLEGMLSRMAQDQPSK
jgi:hypothetical protein